MLFIKAAPHLQGCRDTKILETADVVVDVGGVCDPRSHRYDHHQREFTETFDKDHTIRLSSAGLVYKYFGREILSHVLETTDKAVLELLYQKMYTNFVEGLDGVDNGVDQYIAVGLDADTTSNPPALKTAKVHQQYKISTDLSARVGRLNPVWNDPSPNPDEKFREAIQMTGKEFLDSLNYFAKSWLPCRDIVLDAVKNAQAKTGDDQIVVLSRFCPWKAHLFDIEEELGIKGRTKYCLFEDQSKTWRVQCVSVSESSFQNRISLPEPWRGKRDSELSQLSGVAGCIFVHATGFIGGNATFDGALQMAKKAIQAQ